MSEAAIRAALSIDNVRAHVAHVTETMPSRLAGSENAARMAEYGARQLSEAGLEAYVQTLPALVRFPGAAELQVEAPRAMSIPAHTLGHSLLTPPGGVSGELVYVASGGFADYEGKDVAGMITLSELSYAPGRHEKQRIAGLMGSTAQIMMNWGHPESDVVPFGSVKPAWGNPTPHTARTEMPTLPCIGIPRTDGLALKALCEQGPVRIRLATEVDNGWRDVKLTLGELSAPASDDFVLVGGHQDSWFGPAATDNAAGTACMVELARVFAPYRERLRRGLLFAFWTAHETGTMASSTWFVDHHWDRLREHAVAYLEVDQPAVVGTSHWGSYSSIEMRRFHETIEDRLLGNTPHHWGWAFKAGDASFFGLGIPQIGAFGEYTPEELTASANAAYGWFHHSMENTIDKLDWEYMTRHLEVYAAYLWELCTAPILPFEFGGLARRYRERLEEFGAAGHLVGLDGVIARANALETAARRLDEVAQTWRGRYETGKVVDDGPATAIDACIKRLSRLLSPTTTTVAGPYGQDPYSFTPQNTMIPCLYDLEHLARLPEGGEERRQLETQLVRERNRVSDTLADARAAIEATLADGSLTG